MGIKTQQIQRRIKRLFITGIVPIKETRFTETSQL